MRIAARFGQVLSAFGWQFKAEPRVSLFSEAFVDQWLNLFTSMADPDEVLKKAGISRPMLRALTGDDEITTAMDTRREALLAVPWRLEPVGGTEGSIPEPVQWLWTEFERQAESLLSSCMEALPYGYSVQQMLYRPAENGRIGWRGVLNMPFEWYVPQRDGTFLYRSSKAPEGEPVDERKLFITVRRGNDFRNPYGEALFSRLYWPWFFRSQGWRFWGRWLERFGTPLLIGKTMGDAATMASELAKVVQNATIAVGNGDEIQIAENKGGAGHFEGFERACCARIQKLILGQTLTTDSGGSSGTSGSYALGKVHDEVRKDRRDADVRMVRRTVQKVVDMLWALNRFPGAAPTFVMADDTGLEADRAERDATLANASIVRFTEDYLLRVYDFEPEDIVVPEPRQAVASAPVPQKKQMAALFAAAPRFTPEQQVIEAGIDGALASLGDVIADAEIKAAIRLATTPDDLVERLSRLLEDAPAEDFRRVLERALFAADILGYAHAAPVQ